MNEWFDVANGVEAKAYLVRHEEKWAFVLFTKPWLEDDLRAELEKGMAFIINPESERTNGIPFVQIERGN